MLQKRTLLRPGRLLTLGALAGLLVLLVRFSPDPEARRDTAWRNLARVVADTILSDLGKERKAEGLPSPDLPAPFLGALEIYLGPGQDPGRPGGVRLQPEPSGPEEVRIRRIRPEADDEVKTFTYPVRNGTSILPTFAAIAAALLLRRTLVPLILGVVLGALLMEGFNPFGASIRIARDYFWRSATDQFYASLILFILGLIGMVGIGIRSGGVRGMVDALLRRVRSKRGIRLLGPCLGFLIFFDDYSNTVVIGNAMRPVTDRLRIPREKLAYIVDSTAAPMAGLMFFSTWIWYEVSQIQAPLVTLGAIDTPEAAYGVFLSALPFRFYCIFTLAFVVLNALLCRDFGPMLEAERRAAATGQVVRPGSRPLLGRSFADLEAKAGIPHRAWNIAVPLGVTLVLILTGLYVFREPGQALGGKSVTGTILASCALTGAVVAGAMAVGQGLLTLKETLQAFFSGLRAALLAICILFLAWAIGGVCRDLGTAEYLSTGLGRGLSPAWLPGVLFLLAALISFSIGSSFSTMGILLPISVPLVHTLAGAAGLEPMSLTIIAIAAVLDGAIFGDHCSPLSDTTVLSSIASGSDHLDHVKTQLPYALTTMGLALGVGYLPGVLGLGPIPALAIGLLGCLVLLRVLGKRV